MLQIFFLVSFGSHSLPRDSVLTLTVCFLSFVCYAARRFYSKYKKSKSLPVTTASQRHLLAPLLPRPQPPAPIASTSTSVSPSPFAPLPSKSSSSSPSHPATKEAPEMGHRTHTGSEYVIMHATTASRGVETGHGNSSRDASQSAAGGVQETAAVDSPLDPYPPSQQVCPSLRTVLLCTSVYAYVV